jgi:hypothetical protein
MNFLKYSLLICSLNLLFSCASFEENITNTNRVKLTRDNISLLDGNYLNNTAKKVLPLDYFWGSNYKMKEYNTVYNLVYEKDYPYQITLKTISDRKIHVNVYVDGNILKSFVIKGKIKDGYFEQNRKMFVIPAFMINVYHSSKFRIGLLNNGNLITDFKKYEFGTAYLIAPFNKSENITNLEHNRIKEVSTK